MIVGGIMFLFAMVPGLPTLSMGFVGLIFIALGYALYKLKLGDFTLPTVQTKAEIKAQAAAGMSPSTHPEGTDAPSIKPTAPKKSPEEIAQEEEAALDDILKVEMLNSP